MSLLAQMFGAIRKSDLPQTLAYILKSPANSSRTVMQGSAGSGRVSRQGLVVVIDLEQDLVAISLLARQSSSILKPVE
jgi:hypothetical protein